MKVNYNVSAMIANNALQTSDNKLSASIARLSSGLKISSAKDNPSGLAMARRMNAQIESLKTANDSTNDGISIIETADGVLGEIQDMLQRMNELSIKSSNGTLTDDDRATIQEEMDQLKNEVTRISETTEFNGKTLLDGSYDLTGYATVGGVTDSKISVSSYSDSVVPGTSTITGLKCTYTDPDEVENTLSDVSITSITSGGKEYSIAAGNLTISTDADIITFTGTDGFMLQMQVDESLNTATDVSLDLTGNGAMSVQVGANEGQRLDIRIPTISLANLGITNVDASTKDLATASIDAIKSGLSYVSAVRSRLGAYQNRLESTDSSTDTTTENMTSAYSRIMDTDMAEEMTTYSTEQVLSQAGISILSQANNRPSEVLQLLQ